MRILYVISFPPFPIERSGGAIRSRLLLDALNKCGDVDILYLNYRGPEHDLSASSFDGEIRHVSSIAMPGSNGSKFERHLEKASRAAGMVFGSGLATAGLRVSGAAAEAISALIKRNEVDLIVGRLSRTAAAAGLLSAPRPLIVDADDWEPSRTAARIKSTPRYNIALHAYLQRELQGSNYLGNQVLERAGHVWLASESDTLMLARPHVTTLPNLPLSDMGNAIQALPPSSPNSKKLFAVGQWSKSQNSDGMNWYLREVWPLIRKREPQAEMRIAGGVPALLASEWGSIQNVHMLGFVDELHSEYETAAVVATPITWGGGTKIKVLEALAYGRVPAGTRHAFEGLADPGSLNEIAVIENEAVSLAEKTCALLADPSMRRKRESAAWQYYRDNYSVAAFDKHVRDTVDSVMDGPKP